MSRIKQRLTPGQMNYLRQQLLSHFDTPRAERSWQLPARLGFPTRKITRILGQLKAEGYIEQLSGQTTDVVYRTTAEGQRELCNNR